MSRYPPAHIAVAAQDLASVQPFERVALGALEDLQGRQKGLGGDFAAIRTAEVAVDAGQDWARCSWTECRSDR